MLNCKQATELASSALDRKLSLRQKISLNIHLLVCGLCRAYVRQIGFIRRLAPQISERIERQPHQLSDEAKNRIRKKLGN